MSDAPADKAAVNDLKALDNAGEQSQEDKEKAAAAADYSNRSVDGKPSMEVKVYSPFHDYYDGEAFSLSAESATGPFDILPRHHNFISLLVPCIVTVRTVDKGEQKIRISGGIIHVKADRTIVFLDV